MKKMICLLCALCLLAGCTQTQPSAPTTEPTQQTTLATEPTTDPEVSYLRDNLPSMDGSTSLIPLEAGIRAAIYDISQEAAADQVNHSTTWQSFHNLLSGHTDLVLSSPLSAEQRQQAEDFGITLETVPITMEGFVFMVNAKNPVDSLTQQQLKDIYSGRITNWSQVGGLDEAIIPYQRNSDSGSQNFMTEFMGETPLMDAPTELRPASMSGLMDVIAVSDNSRAAIGYSVYTYAANMYGNGDEIKFIQVDGIAPSKAAFASGDYPLMGCNYAVFRADEPADSNVRRLVNWMLTQQGQTVIAKAGYVTVVDVGYDYTEATLEKYQGIGTGPAAGEVPSTEYVLLGTLYYWDGGPYATPQLIPETVELPDGTNTYRVNGLADKGLEVEINGWIDEQMVWVAEEHPKLTALIDAWNQGSEYHIFEPGFPWSDSQPEGMDAACIITAKNGYLSVAITLGYLQNVFYSYERSYHTETATWDLISGKRLTPEELFCQGVEIHSVLNDYIRAYSQAPVDHTGYITDMKQDFAALPDFGWHITHDAIYFDYGNPYFAQGDIISLENLPDGILACQQPRDFSQALETGSDLSCQEQFRVCERDYRYTYNSDGYISCTLLKEDSHPNAEKINREVMAYVDAHFTEDAIRTHFAEAGYGYDCDIDTGMGLEWYLTKLGNEFLIFRGTSPMLYWEDEIIRYPYANHLIYDLTTGEQISWQDMLVEGWESQLLTDGTDLSTLTMDFLFYIINDWGAPLCVCFEDGTSLDVPIDWIRH